MKIGYLGPQGTFSEQAALKIASNNQIIPFSSIWEAMESTELGKTDKCVVPLENSIEGCVNTTIDSLIFDVNLFIEGQINIPIEQSMFINKLSNNKKITKIFSHPQGFAQCRMFLRENYPNAELISTNSTAEGGRLIKDSSEAWAAIGLSRLAEIYDLKILHKSIQDNDKNFTQFVVLSKNDTTKNFNFDKVSIAFSVDNKPGMLCRVLDLFNVWDLNMTEIVSRPMRAKTEEYVFLTDLEMNDSPDDIRNCLFMVQRKTSFFKNLGAYTVYDYR